MAMHLVLGDGEMSKKELTETLKDLAPKDDEPFWFVVQGKSEPTSTDQALVKWMVDNAIYFDVLTDDADSMDSIYEAGQTVHTAKRLSQKVVSLINTLPEDDETTDILALFASDDPTAEEDRWLNTVIQAAFEGARARDRFRVLAFNDGLVEVDLSPVAETEVSAEPEPVTTTPSKRAPRKTEAEPKPTKDESLSKDYTREELEELDLPALKDIAAARGIELPARTRMVTYIAHILGEVEGGVAVEVEEPPITRVLQPEEDGEVTMDHERLAQMIYDAVVDKIIEALKA